eukprot:3498331-Amphidinium_carterae.1
MAERPTPGECTALAEELFEVSMYVGPEFNCQLRTHRSAPGVSIALNCVTLSSPRKEIDTK